MPANPLSIEQAAALCHETNRAYCAALGDHTQLPWLEAPQWQRESAINGVRYRLTHQWSSASASHVSWLKEKMDAGWSYGPEKDPVKKTHPCIVPFEHLPPEQKVKDYLFVSVVESLRENKMIVAVAP